MKKDRVPPLITDEVQELLAIRDALLQELNSLIDRSIVEAFPSTIDAENLVERVRARTAECGNGWVGPAWDWPSRRIEE